MLLVDHLGNTVRTPTDSVAEGLRPSSSIGLKHQTPHTHKGVKLSSEVLEKLESLWADLPKFQAFPQVPPRLMSYLYSNDEFGDTAVQPGALIDVAPLEPQVQGVKYWVSRYGLRYSLEQTFTYAGMNDTVQGDKNLGKYDLYLPLKWTVFDASSAGTAGWLSAQIEYQTAIGGDQGQTAQTNIGSLTNPTGFWSTHSGFQVSELAWQQSFLAGQAVVLAGVVNQGNYIDANTYANSGRGQFINSALINSMVLPLPSYNYGLNLQWQPKNDWYTMLGYSVGNAAAGESP